MIDDRYLRACVTEIERVFYARTGIHMDSRVAEALATAIIQLPKDKTP